MTQRNRRPARPGSGPRAFSLTAPSTLERLDAIGCPVDVAVALHGLDIGLVSIERVPGSGIGWGCVSRILTSGTGCRSAEDFLALLNFAYGGEDATGIERWARLGSLDAALRIERKGVGVGIVEAFPRAAHHDLADFLRMLQRTGAQGIHPDTLLWWHSAGVVSMTAPFVDPDSWRVWRSVATTHLGMRRAALCAGAGLSPSEAVEQYSHGTLDEETLKFMAGLRA